MSEVLGMQKALDKLKYLILGLITIFVLGIAVSGYKDMQFASIRKSYEQRMADLEQKLESAKKSNGSNKAATKADYVGESDYLTLTLTLKQNDKQKLSSLENTVLTQFFEIFNGTFLLIKSGKDQFLSDTALTVLSITLNDAAEAIMLLIEDTYSDKEEGKSFPHKKPDSQKSKPDKNKIASLVPIN